jgi:hypothetical protein
MHTVGRLVAARDEVGQFFVFSVCTRCRDRLERLPIRLQGRQLLAALRQVAAHPDRYPFRQFPGEIEARLYCRLEAERLGVWSMAAG